jgi:hypothetical protein
VGGWGLGVGGMGWGGWVGGVGRGGWGTIAVQFDLLVVVLWLEERAGLVVGTPHLPRALQPASARRRR